jgi:UDP-N-acetylmuramoyl-L-alanyl-D-glutamate--2,6-diaminopimelate ligase
MEAYLAAKLRLFSDLIAPGGTAVINADDCYSGQVIETAKARGLKVLTVGEHADGIKLVDGTIEGFGQRVTFAYAGKQYRVKLPLVGNFQVQNAAVSAGLVLATDGDPDRVFAALENLQGAKGRLELAGSFRDAPVFIDYAHKPDALQKAIDALRPYTRRQLIVVFGCGGDRDKGKRPIMGRIASEHADRVIVTDDNPRSENPAAIRAEILAAAPGAEEIGDRGEAIGTSISRLENGDVLLIAGKGHETGQIVGNRVLDFSDHAAVAAALGDI